MQTSSLSLFTILTLVPSITFALSIEPRSYYTDVRQNSVEKAGIDLLTSEGIVQGYDANHFLPTRQINRAEFLKITLPLYIRDHHSGDPSGYPWQFKDSLTENRCFPDVTLDDWFGMYVCEAKTLGFVNGYSDGYFHPERTVSYGEALKILTTMFDYTIPQLASSDWAVPYYRAASDRGVDLPMTIRFDTSLTRGRAARLAAAFLAESEGQLVALRMAEAGQYGVQQSSVSSSAISSSSSSVTSSSSSSSSSVASSALFTLPPVSHFLVVGQTSDAVASMTIKSTGETAKIVTAQVKLFNEATAISSLELVRADTGAPVATLQRKITTDTLDYKLTYEVQLPLESQVPIPADIDVPLVLRAVVRDINNAGASDQLLHVRTFTLTTRGDTTNTTYNYAAQGPFPKHQTSFGRITKVQSLLPATQALQAGTGMLIASFSVSGSSISGKSLLIEQMIFSVLQEGAVSVDQWQLNRTQSTVSAPCSINQDGTVLSCLNVHTLGTLEKSTSNVFELRANVRVSSGQVPPRVQVTLSNPGTPEDLGSVQWTDESGYFRWIEGKNPLMLGPVLR